MVKDGLEGLTRRDFLQRGKKATKGTLAWYLVFGGTTAGLVAAENVAFNTLEEKLFGEYRETFAELERLGQIVERDIGVGLELVRNEIPERLTTQRVHLERVYGNHVEDWQQMGVVTVEETQALGQIIQNLQNYEASYTQWEAFHELFDRVALRAAQVGREVESRLPGWIQDMHEGIHELPLIGAGTPEERQTAYDRLDSLVSIYDTNRDNMLAQEAVVAQISEYLDDSNLTQEERDLYNYLKDQMEESHRRGNVNNDVREFILEYNNINEDMVQRIQLQRLQEVIEQLDVVFDQYVPAVQELQTNLDAGIELRERLRAYDPRVEGAGDQLTKYQQATINAHDQVERLKARLEELEISVSYEPDFELGIPIPDFLEKVVAGARYITMAGTVAGTLGTGMFVRRLVNKRRAKDAHTQLGKALYAVDELATQNEFLRAGEHYDPIDLDGERAQLQKVIKEDANYAVVRREK
jgi:hypothetical protein